MAESKSQNLENHTRFDPPFHLILLPVFATNFVVSLVGLFRTPSMASGWQTVVAVGALLAVFLIRIYSLRVQDRVIRLEERLRLSAIGNESLRARLADLSVPQVVALRFASDEEAPALAGKALSEGLTNKQIKRAIANWRPDYLRV